MIKTYAMIMDELNNYKAPKNKLARMINDGVYTFTSATFEKNRTKRYETPFGVFTYRDVPSSVYSYGISHKTEGEYVYQIATPEKALCDKLYTISPIGNKKELINFLFEDLRIDEVSFNSLDFDIIDKLCKLYHCTNLKLLQKLLR